MFPLIPPTHPHTSESNFCCTLHRGFIFLYSSVLVSPAVILTLIDPTFEKRNLSFSPHPNMLVRNPSCSAENDNGPCRLRHQVRVHLLVMSVVFVFVCVFVFVYVFVFLFAGWDIRSAYTCSFYVWSPSVKNNIDTFRLMLESFSPLSKIVTLSVLSKRWRMADSVSVEGSDFQCTHRLPLLLTCTARTQRHGRYI